MTWREASDFICRLLPAFMLDGSLISSPKWPILLSLHFSLVCPERAQMQMKGSSRHIHVCVWVCVCQHSALLLIGLVQEELLISHLMHRNPSRCPFSLGCGKRSLSLLACCRFSFFQFATPTCMRLAWQVKKKFWGNKPARFCVCVYVCSLVILRGHLLLERLPKLPCKCTTHDVVSLVTWHLTPETGNQSWDFCYFFIQSWLFFFFFLQSEAISGSSGESIVNNCKFMFIRAWNGHDWMRVILFQDVFCQEISSWL